MEVDGTLFPIPILNAGHKQQEFRAKITGKCSLSNTKAAIRAYSSILYAIVFVFIPIRQLVDHSTVGEGRHL